MKVATRWDSGVLAAIAGKCQVNSESLICREKRRIRTMDDVSQMPPRLVPR